MRSSLPGCLVPPFSNLLFQTDPVPTWNLKKSFELILGRPTKKVLPPKGSNTFVKFEISGIY